VKPDRRSRRARAGPGQTAMRTRTRTVPSEQQGGEIVDRTVDAFGRNLICRVRLPTHLNESVRAGTSFRPRAGCDRGRRGCPSGSAERRQGNGGCGRITGSRPVGQSSVRKRLAGRWRQIRRQDAPQPLQGTRRSPVSEARRPRPRGQRDTPHQARRHQPIGACSHSKCAFGMSEACRYLLYCMMR
jgi:hypothetical protein